MWGGVGRGKSMLITLIDLPFSVSPVVSGLMFVLLFAGSRDIARYLWHRSQESVFDDDIASAYRSNNATLAEVRTEHRRLWLKSHPPPAVTWLGWPLVGLVIATLVVVAVVVAIALHLSEMVSNVKAELFAGPYRQVR